MSSLLFQDRFKSEDCGSKFLQKSADDTTRHHIRYDLELHLWFTFVNQHQLHEHRFVMGSRTRRRRNHCKHTDVTNPSQNFTALLPRAFRHKLAPITRQGAPITLSSLWDRRLSQALRTLRRISKKLTYSLRFPTAVRSYKLP